MRWPLAGLMASAALGCVGVIDEPPAKPGPAPEPIIEIPSTAIPRLSRRELDAQLFAVFGVRGAATRNLPADPPSAINPVTNADEEVFDTLAATKEPSQVFVEGLEGLALDVGTELVKNPGAVATLAGCTPSGTGVDTTCLGAFVDRVALLLWRRPISAEERDSLVAALLPVAQTAPTPHLTAVQGAVMALINSPELAYRLELGTPGEPGLRVLSQSELISRLSFFLWGDSPDAALLNLPPLDDAAFTALVDRMLDDPRGKAQQRAFHQLWLRYASLLVTDVDLAQDMLAESDALLEHALFTPGTPWTTLFTSTKTWVTPRLAQHYGLSTPATSGWVDLDAPRAGLVSHGSFLSLSATRGTETLPSRRGAIVSRRLLCQTVQPPPKDVNVDNGVEVMPGTCKKDAYAAHRRPGSSCAGCHTLIDGVGFGLERLDGLGRIRLTEAANPSCAIDGEGTVGAVRFSGPRELVQTQLSTLTSCAVSQLARFAFRDRRVPGAYLKGFHQAFVDSGYNFKQLMRTVALEPRFRLRFEEGGP